MELTGRRECAIIEVSDKTGWEGGREVMVQPKITMVGRTYGRLTVLEQAEPLKKDRQAWYRCRCDCGGKITVRGPGYLSQWKYCKLWLPAAGENGKEEKCRSRRKEVRSDRKTIPSHSREEGWRNERREAVSGSAAVTADDIIKVRHMI